MCNGRFRSASCPLQLSHLLGVVWLYVQRRMDTTRQAYGRVVSVGDAIMHARTRTQNAQNLQLGTRIRPYCASHLGVLDCVVAHMLLKPLLGYAH
jgi:hypothetical protein